MREDRKNNSFMKRIIKYFLIIIFCMVLLNAFSSFRFKYFYDDIYGRLARLADIYSISLYTGEMYKDIDNYTHSGTEDYLRHYDAEHKKLTSLAARLREGTEGDGYYTFGDIQNMILTFDEQSRRVIAVYSKNVQPVYINEGVSELSKLKGFIDDEIKNELVKQLASTMEYYKNYINDFTRQENMIYCLIALITIGCIAAAVRFSRDISKPVNELVQRLRKVAKGDFEIEDIKTERNDEISELIESYKFMTAKIQKLIEEIRTKADIEKELTEQQIKNLEMRNLLNQSELKFLQSQINPHFLYNTLNSISALAIMEGAEQTMRMIGCISEILKYYLKKINENVTLMEELKIVESYLYIQKARFGDRIEYRLYYDEGVILHSVPGMILQPFVENAVIHGLEPKELKGRVDVSILDIGEDILIKVEDDGIGMEEETLRTLMRDRDDSEGGKASSEEKGIGVANVIRRLELKYGRNIVDIESSRGKGTEVSIRLPKAV